MMDNIAMLYALECLYTSPLRLSLKFYYGQKIELGKIHYWNDDLTIR